MECNVVNTLSNRFHIAHRYLAQQPPTNQFSPASIERIVNKIVDRSVPNGSHVKPVAVVIAKSEPNIWAPWTDMTRSRKAFGNWCIPKLRKDLCSAHTMIVSQALCTLADMLHNPETACQALSLNLHSRFVRLLARDNCFVRQRTLLCISILATQPLGNVTMSRNVPLMKAFKRCLNDSSYLIKNHAISALHAFLYNPLARETFVKQNFVRGVIECCLQYKDDFNQEFYVESYLVLLIECLNYLVQESNDAKVQAMAYGVFDLFELLNHDNFNVRNAIAVVYGELFKHKIGRMASYYWPFIENFNQIIQAQSYCVSTWGTVSTLRFATLTAECRKCAIECGMVEYLVSEVKATCDKEKLTNLAQTLICLAEHPEGRMRLRNIGPELMFVYEGTDTRLFQQILTLFNTINKTF